MGLNGRSKERGFTSLGKGSKTMAEKGALFEYMGHVGRRQRKKNFLLHNLKLCCLSHSGIIHRITLVQTCQIGSCGLINLGKGRGAVRLGRMVW